MFVFLVSFGGFLCLFVYLVSGVTPLVGGGR